MNFNISDQITGDLWKGVNSIIIKENNIPINLTNCEVYMQFISNKNNASPIFYEISTEKNNISISNALSGIISIPEQIIDIPVGDYKYNLYINFPSGKTKTYLEGNFKILPHITRVKNNTDIYSPLYNQKLLITDLLEERIITIDGERMNYI